MTFDTDWATQAACRRTDPDSLFVQGAAQNRAKGMSIEENAQWLEDNKLHLAHWFTVTVPPSNSRKVSTEGDLKVSSFIAHIS